MWTGRVLTLDVKCLDEVLDGPLAVSHGADWCWRALCCAGPHHTVPCQENHSEQRGSCGGQIHDDQRHGQMIGVKMYHIQRKGEAQVVGVWAEQMKDMVTHPGSSFEHSF